MIRRATADDAAALAQFAARTFRETFAAENTPEDMDAYVAKFYGESQQRVEILDANIVTLIDDDNGIAAFAQLKLDRFEIGRFYVDRSAHGRGLAQELMRAVLDEARAHGAKRVWLGVWERNQCAIAFYAKCGFRDTGSHPFLLGNDLQTDRVMEIELGERASRPQRSRVSRDH